MTFITSLFGTSGNTVITAILALGIVVVLIVLGVWLLKLVFNASTTVARGRNRRLSIVESLPIDPKRQLIIVRRDDVDHLILTGGPQDLVIETSIAVREQPAAAPVRRPLPAVGPRLPIPRPPAPLVKPAIAQPAPLVVPERPVEPTLAAGLRRAPLLRNTGLLRAVGRVDGAERTEPHDNSAPQRPDSVKQDQAFNREGAQELDDQGEHPHPDERKADGH